MPSSLCALIGWRPMSNPAPSSRTRTWARRFRATSSTSTRPAPAYLPMLVNASCTRRNTVSSADAASRTGSSALRPSTPLRSRHSRSRISSGATDVLARSPVDAAIQQRFLGIIQRQNRHFRRIVDDLLDVSRMRSGQIALAAPHALELSGCVGSCVESLRVTERGRNHRWRVHTDEVWVWGDPMRLEQIVNNLAVDALQYSPPNAAIGVVVRATAGEAVIEVTDAGPGIAPEWRDRIFEPFVRGPLAANRPPSGPGIGLSLDEELVELHRGRISVRPGPGGIGSTFSVSLPRRVAPAEGTPVEAPERMSRAESPQRPAYRVLLVDDHAEVREATARLMRSMGHDVTEAADGADAVTSALARIPDVVVMDLGLPGRNGYAVAAEMRALPALRGVPLIALSGYGQPGDRAASQRPVFRPT